MTIYLDIIFLENLCMNYIILFATCYIMVGVRSVVKNILLKPCNLYIYNIFLYATYPLSLLHM